jgi:hypothetical protein
MMAATGKQLKQSVNVFQILMLYLRLPAQVEFTRSLDRGEIMGELQAQILRLRAQKNMNREGKEMMGTDIHRRNRRCD